MSVDHLLLLLETLKAQSSRTTMGVGHLLLLLETLKAQSSRTTVSIGHLLLLLKTLKAQSLGHLLLLLKSQSSRTPRGKGRLLLLLKTKSSMTPWRKVHLLLLPRTLICIHLQSNQSSCPTLIERLISHFLLHSNRFLRMLRIVHLVAFLFLSRKFRTSIRALVDKCFKFLNHS
jgi:hypothetical protein